MRSIRLSKAWVLACLAFAGTGLAANANAGWLGFRNETSAAISIQVSTNGRLCAPIRLNPNEFSWNFVADDSTSSIMVSSMKKEVLVRFETVPVTRKEDVMYAIQASSKDKATATQVPGAKKGR